MGVTYIAVVWKTCEWLDPSKVVYMEDSTGPCGTP